MPQLRRVLVLPIALLLSAGAVASYRAYVPVSRLELEVRDPALHPGTPLRVHMLSSGRGPIEVRVELVQGAHNEVVAVQRIHSRRWGVWDPRTVEHSLNTSVAGPMLAHFTNGPAVLRAVALGAPAWLLQPPPVVREIPVEIRHD